MKKLKHLFITFSVFLFINKINAQTNNVTLEEYSNIKIENVFLEEINNTNGNIALMQNLFQNTLTIEKGYNDAVEHWIKFSTNSLCIEFYNGIKVSSEIKYDLANIDLENNSSNIKIKNKIVKLGDNADVLGDSEIRTHNGGKIIIFSLPQQDPYIYILTQYLIKLLK